jgi:hypothetical protein
VPNDPAAVNVEKRSLARSDEIKIEMRAGGGFVARFTGF